MTQRDRSTWPTFVSIKIPKRLNIHPATAPALEVSGSMCPLTTCRFCPKTTERSFRSCDSHLAGFFLNIDDPPSRCVRVECRSAACAEAVRLFPACRARAGHTVYCETHDDRELGEDGTILTNDSTLRILGGVDHFPIVGLRRRAQSGAAPAHRARVAAKTRAPVRGRLPTPADAARLKLTD
ncbi:hypothetical protein EVAR_31714_1 [Eumeta japonica]|uniref:Uncharacterized protein n=1 Tax=Eumeta variegata TaxID=151549 RepID=A0A4C1VTC3_EUMVA|nr:hypothetical protein EVAR_31714_1 [Eumeta japonica]